MKHAASELPMRDVRRTEVPSPPEVPKGLDAVVNKCIGSYRSRKCHSRELWEAAGRCEAAFREIRGIPEKELRAKIRHHQAHIRRLGGRWKEGFDDALPVLVEAARRSFGLEAYRTQMMGAMALARGTLVEMATGEGKTLTIALAAAAAGWSGRPLHVVTANDYLARRDAEELQVFYEACGLRAAAIQVDLKPHERREVYEAPIVYCTGKELVADLLRDRILLGNYAEPTRRNVMRLSGYTPTQQHTVLRGIYTAFVDEADNQLIDEAVTPLIISRKDENSLIEEASERSEELAASLLPGEHYELNNRYREARLIEAGRAKVAEWCEGQAGFLSATDWMCDLVNQALQARHYFLKDKQYVIVDGKIVIVDEFTGRPMPGRSWRLGLHQAVEAKEQLEVSKPSETLARLSFQRFYRLFRHLSGITGTARESRHEFWGVYALPFIEVPRHRPNQRKDAPLRFFADEPAKWRAIVEEIRELHALGRPVLVGTRSVSASEHLARLLDQEKLSCSILNAVRHEQEATIIRLAGAESSITIATNMAGRGTDIRLAGKVVKLGGLHVILSEGHESGRVDRQLMGRAGRQGDPGSTSRYVSIEDELIQRFSLRPVRALTHTWLRSRLPAAQILARICFRWAQFRAEGKSLRQRVSVMRQDAEMSKKLMVSTIDKI
ncbi:MAG: hypothetical protein JJU20_01520 [Opitutales bacterium]|nr:hypothetical protein [Opitutales bacterium]